VNHPAPPLPLLPLLSINDTTQDIIIQSAEANYQPLPQATTDAIGIHPLIALSSSSVSTLHPLKMHHAS